MLWICFLEQELGMETRQFWGWWSIHGPTSKTRQENPLCPQNPIWGENMPPPSNSTGTRDPSFISTGGVGGLDDRDEPGVVAGPPELVPVVNPQDRSAWWTGGGGADPRPLVLDTSQGLRGQNRRGGAGELRSQGRSRNDEGRRGV